SREDRADPASNQIGREGPQTIILAFRPSIFDRQVVTFDIADFAQSLMESTQPGRITVGRCAVEKTDSWELCRLLRAGSERPRGRCAAECGQQFPSSDGDCHAPLPCEVREGNDTTPRAYCP